MEEEVSYDLRIYSKEAIFKAIFDYTSIATVKTINIADQLMLLKFSALSNLQEIILEFNNYAIQIENMVGDRG